MQQPAAKFYQNSSRIKIALITVIVAIVGGLIVYLFTPQKSRDLDYPYNGNGSVTFKEEQQLAMAMFTPPDSDEDGLSDALEIQIGSKINLADSDKDGVNDQDELSAGMNPVGTGILADSTIDSVRRYGAWYFRYIQRGLDAKRINDIKNIQVLLELYLADNHEYPASGGKEIILGDDIKGLGKTGWLPYVIYPYGALSGNATPGGIAFVYCTTRVDSYDCTDTMESYVLKFKLEQDVTEQFKAGLHFATPGRLD